MAQTKILLDTNSYLRLAVNLHPLLFVSYGKEFHTLSTAMELGIRVVTDDQGMLDLAREYEVKTWTTLELMKSMLDAGHIDMAMVRRVVDNWVYDGDLPAKKLREPYKDLFSEDPPQGF